MPSFDPPPWPSSSIDNDNQVEPALQPDSYPDYFPAFADEEADFYKEDQRQLRIAAGEEQQCFMCGCSDSHACPGGCAWATPTVCSRCAREVFYGG